MYDYGYDYGYPSVETTTGLLGGFTAMMGTIMLILLPSIIMIVSQWIIFKKAGKKGWEAIVPIYNMIVLLEITGLPMWYIALFFVPIAQIYAMFKIYIELAHKFGKSTGFGVLTVFFSYICLPILAFGKNNVYNGNNVQNPQSNNNMNTYQNNNIVNNMSTNNQQPLAFNQNINTEINNIPGVNINNNLNTSINSIPQPEINQTPVFNSTTPIVNSEPVLNTIPNVEPLLQPQTSVEPVNNINNQVNQPSENIFQPANTFKNEEPTPVVNPQPVFEQPVNNAEQQNVGQQLNAIPGMEQTQQSTMTYQNNHNQNM